MNDAQAGAAPRRIGTFAPLSVKVFRNIWFASLFSNFGQLILGVGAAWEMTRLTNNSPTMVALVQTAVMLPLFLVAVPAGAIADMFDRRKIALAGLGFAVIAGAVLAAASYAGLVTPWLLLGALVLIGGGVAIYAPAWQSSIGEQVPGEYLPAAVSLGSMNYNIARSFGPALGGLIVLAVGAKATFALNAAFYMPLWVIYFLWRRVHRPSRLPPERIDRAMVSGVRYAFHSPSIRAVLVRVMSFALSTASYIALGPLIAKQSLRGDASTYGLILGVTGVGAISGALMLARARQRLESESVLRVATLLMATALIVVALSQFALLTLAAFFVLGFANTQAMSLNNIIVQLTAPRWVTARALSLYTSAYTGGIALGAWLWGEVAAMFGLSFTLAVSAGAVALTVLLGRVMPLPSDEDIDTQPAQLGSEPQVALGLTMRSGPVVIEVEYKVDPERARDFYELALQLQKIRHRNGGFDWSISRDIADPAIWTERYHCPTWGDYLRMRDRYTQSDLDVQLAVDGYDCTEGERRVRRWLERPYGSVRWKADSPDPKSAPIGYIAP